MTLYHPHDDGTFTTLDGPVLPAGFLSASIASADLNGDGWGDLVIAAADSNRIFVSLQTAAGVFEPLNADDAYTVGRNPSAIAFTDVNGDSRRDILVTNRFSGQVSVLLNLGNGHFRLEEERFRAGTGLYGLIRVNDTTTVQSLAGTNGFVVGPFDEDECPRARGRRLSRAECNKGMHHALDLVHTEDDARTVVLRSGVGADRQPRGKDRHVLATR